MTEKRQEQTPVQEPEMFPERVNTPEREDSGDFDWGGSDVVIERQPRTAIYLNPHGHVVIRQESWPDDDTWVTIDPRHLPDVIEWLKMIYERS